MALASIDNRKLKWVIIILCVSVRQTEYRRRLKTEKNESEFGKGKERNTQRFRRTCRYVEKLFKIRGGEWGESIGKVSFILVMNRDSEKKENGVNFAFDGTFFFSLPGVFQTTIKDLSKNCHKSLKASLLKRLYRAGYPNTQP